MLGVEFATLTQRAPRVYDKRIWLPESNSESGKYHEKKVFTFVLIMHRLNYDSLSYRSRTLFISIRSPITPPTS